MSMLLQRIIRKVGLDNKNHMFKVRKQQRTRGIKIPERAEAFRGG